MLIPALLLEVLFWFLQRVIPKDTVRKTPNNEVNKIPEEFPRELWEREGIR